MTAPTVSIFDLTDEQIAAAVAARRERPEPPRPDDDYWRGVLAARRAATVHAETQRIATTRRCDRCGIDTTEPTMCRDCVDVEGAA